jgi:hypothetical protein
MKLGTDESPKFNLAPSFCWLAIIILCVTATGCAINRGTIREKDPAAAVKSNKGIVLIDAGYYTKGGLVKTVFQELHKLLRRDAIERQFYLIDSKAKRTEDGRLSLYFLFQNTYGVRNWLDLQIVFYDEDRRVVETTTWEVKEFPKMVKTTYEKKSLGATAVGYELYVRDYR